MTDPQSPSQRPLSSVGCYFQAPKRFSKPPEGMVGAAPLSTLGGFASGLAGAGGAAAAVFVSAACGSDFFASDLLGSDLARALAVCVAFDAEAAGFDFAAGFSSGLALLAAVA